MECELLVLVIVSEIIAFDVIALADDNVVEWIGL